MVSKDELTWLHMTAKESEYARYMKEVKNSQQLAEHKVKCMAFVESIKEIRQKYPDDEQFGRIVSEILKKERL